MDLSRHFILLNGEPKTQQIDSIRRNGTNGFCIRFKNNAKDYNYGYDKVTWLSSPQWLDPQHCNIFVNGIRQDNVREIWQFGDKAKHYWRVFRTDGFIQDGDETNIRVLTSCLGEQESKDTFTYLKNVAAINPLGKDADNAGILAGIYSKVDFIGDDTAAACYLNPSKHNPKNLRHKDIIYPFGCNASQKRAVTEAFEHQMSVIQGPPGTGKTQTILNILANTVRQGMTALVVSNNNSATANVLEKLEKYGASFIVAPLGSKSNKDAFIANQPPVPAECGSWGLSNTDSASKRQELHATLRQLDKVYALQNERAGLRQEQQAVALEWKHFCADCNIDERENLRNRAHSARIMSLWLKCQAYANGEKTKQADWLTQCFENIGWLWMKWTCRRLLHTNSHFDKNNLTPLIKELQKQYYLNRMEEIRLALGSVERDLAQYDAPKLADTLTDVSMTLFKDSLYSRYANGDRTVFANAIDMKMREAEFRQRFPVVLSTTFSARSCSFTDEPYDYIIMDEASQVSIDTGALALTCAKNAVIVGDTLQLPNVVTEEDKLKLNAVMKQYHIPEGYDCAKNSFLQSVMEVVKNMPKTLLREHYRCHPRIINFCNKKFYGGDLLIMTEDKGEDDVLTAVRTVKGNHAVNHYNQREIDVVKEEVLPTLGSHDDIGIISPYNSQVDAFNRQMDNVKAGTIHKYQGRENDTIILSVVDNQISEFADDANMLNVAVSRAKKKFCLVMTGNEQEKNGNIMDLLDYIAYNNCAVTESKLASIFDYLYTQYTEQRMAFLEANPNISEYASENLTFSMLREILASDTNFNTLKVLCHVPLRQVVKDTTMMSEEERKYASNYNTHLDFLIINQVSKLPVLAVETDGYSFHNDKTEQHRRDMMKDHILNCYGLPLLRLSTRGSGEKEKVASALTLWAT